MDPLIWAKPSFEAGSLTQLIEKIGWIGDEGLAGTIGHRDWRHREKTCEPALQTVLR